MQPTIGSPCVQLARGVVHFTQVLSVQSLGSSSFIIRQRGLEENADDRVPVTASHT